MHNITEKDGFIYGFPYGFKIIQEEVKEEQLKWKGEGNGDLRFNEHIDNELTWDALIALLQVSFVLALQMKSTPLRPFIPSHQSSSAALLSIHKLHGVTPVAHTLKESSQQKSIRLNDQNVMFFFLFFLREGCRTENYYFYSHFKFMKSKMVSNSVLFLLFLVPDSRIQQAFQGFSP